MVKRYFKFWFGSVQNYVDYIDVNIDFFLGKGNITLARTYISRINTGTLTGCQSDKKYIKQKQDIHNQKHPKTS